MPSLKKLVVTGAPFTKQVQEALAKVMQHTQILNCYGKMNSNDKLEHRETYKLYNNSI